MITLYDKICLPNDVFHFLNDWAEECDDYENIFELIESILCTIAYDNLLKEDD